MSRRGKRGRSMVESYSKDYQKTSNRDLVAVSHQIILKQCVTFIQPTKLQFPRHRLGNLQPLWQFTTIQKDFYFPGPTIACLCVSTNLLSENLMKIVEDKKKDELS